MPQALIKEPKSFFTYDQNGKALVETQGDVNMPADYSFECVNDFIHNPNVIFEELQYLCLGLATELEKARGNPNGL